MMWLYIETNNKSISVLTMSHVNEVQFCPMTLLGKRIFLIMEILVELDEDHLNIN